MSFMSLEQIQEIKFKPNGLTEGVYYALVDAIVDGVFKGGERLVEQDLQRHFEVSRSPIREALRKLEKKGLVTIINRKGTFVNKVTLKDIENSFAVRGALEGLAAKNAKARLTKQELIKLKEGVQGVNEAAEEYDPVKARLSAYKFHETYIMACGNNLLIETLRHVPIHSYWKKYLWHYSREDLNKGKNRLNKLLKMFLDKDSDPDELAKGIDNHIVSHGRRFCDFLISEGKIEMRK